MADYNPEGKIEDFRIADRIARVGCVPDPKGRYPREGNLFIHETKTDQVYMARKAKVDGVVKEVDLMEKEGRKRKIGPAVLAIRMQKKRKDP